MIKTEVDPGDVFGRAFTELEQKNLLFATVQAVNATAFATRERWAELMPRVFDRPTALTLRAPLYRKATKQRPYAEVFLRDEAHKGTPPAKYLLAQVGGGGRRMKRSEAALRAAGVLPAGMFTVPGRGAQLDAFGNVPGKQITAILSAVRAQSDQYQNATDASRGRRRAKKKRRGGEYFALGRQRGNLRPGVYERIDTGFGSGVRSVLFFVTSVTYRPRYDVFGAAQAIFDKQLPFHFTRELDKAVATSKFRGKG
ncbi:hypothetical protein ABE488_09245 [Luteimonas sp. TWI662]|uniref:hypothetical protein n=1 Tax=Luteimonas sp. TWI662 TaxID=3136789 RepID=UPI00320B484A